MSRLGRPLDRSAAKWRDPRIVRLPLLAFFLFTFAFAAQAQGPAFQPDFEVAAIKPNNSGNGGSSSGFGRNPDQFQATNVTIRELLRFEAFGIADARIVGGPKWMDSARFDIAAKLDQADAAGLSALPYSSQKVVEQAILQRLLADRLQLKTHWEEREQPIYALAVAKGGAKLQPAADTKHGSGWSMGQNKIDATDATLAQIADLFTQGAFGELGRVVVDRTGIEGVFDIHLKWTPDTGASPSATPDGPSLFTAIQEQLGLKFELAKAPVKVLVIDRLEMPSEN